MARFSLVLVAVLLFAVAASASWASTGVVVHSREATKEAVPLDGGKAAQCLPPQPPSHPKRLAVRASETVKVRLSFAARAVTPFMGRFHGNYKFGYSLIRTHVSNDRRWWRFSTPEKVDGYDGLWLSVTTRRGHCRSYFVGVTPLP